MEKAGADRDRASSRAHRVVFFGTPGFAVPILEALVSADHHVALVVSQPARHAGRGRQLKDPPVAQMATQLGLPLFQPVRARDPSAMLRVASVAPDAVVLAAYGQILPAELLSIPLKGSLNVHPSLLPRYRGASPISAPILAGDTRTGVSIMLMDAGMDTGPILAQEETPILDDDDQVSLTRQLAGTGARLLVHTLDAWLRGAIQPTPQEPSLASTTRRATKEDGLLTWEEPAIDLWRRVRAYAEWPQAFTFWEGKQLRILRATYLDEASAEPGRVIATNERGRSAIGTRRGVLLPAIVGLEGKRPMPMDAFLRGAPRFIGSQLTATRG
ncbi:MAG: fmt [Chloroflexi bacterium]|nr:fmt [Chloroflexota bacterium]